MSGNKRPATDDAVTGQECVHLGGNTILNPPRQILKLDLGPMSRSHCSNQNFQIDLRQKYQTSWRALRARKRWMNSKTRAIAELERRGYEARGKTPAQIRQMLRERRPKRKSTKLDIGGGPQKRKAAARASAAPPSAANLPL